MYVNAQPVADGSKAKFATSYRFGDEFMSRQRIDF
jgi:hypothetical protein